MNDRDAEALAYLSAVLTAFTLLMNFVLQKLGIVLSEKELAKLKEKTLLKQVGPFTVHRLLNHCRRGNALSIDCPRTTIVHLLHQCQQFPGDHVQVKGLHAEYDRLSSQQSKSEDSGPNGAQSQLKAELKTLTTRLQEAEVGQKGWINLCCSGLRLETASSIPSTAVHLQ